MDGAENALGNIYSDGYYEICKNVSLTEHFRASRSSGYQPEVI